MSGRIILQLDWGLGWTKPLVVACCGICGAELARHPNPDRALRADLHGPHDLRRTFATWLEDAGIPGRVIDELMGHDNAHRARLDRVSRIGMGYRDTTPEVLLRAVAAIESRLAVVLEVAERETRQTTGSGKL